MMAVSWHPSGHLYRPPLIDRYTFQSPWSQWLWSLLLLLSTQTLVKHKCTHSGRIDLGTLVHINTEPLVHPQRPLLQPGAIKWWWMACMIATRSSLGLTFLKYSWHSPCGAPCVYLPRRHCAELASRGKRLLCCQMIHMDEPQKAEQSELIGIQDAAALPVSKTFPVWEDHCASRESLNAMQLQLINS